MTYIEECLAGINKRFTVDFTTGIITSKRRGVVMTGTTTSGYIQCHCGNVGGKRKMMKGHQIVYLLYHGELPDVSIDHFDRNKTNNAPSNLRPANMQEQARNKPGDGITTRRGKYRARIRPCIGKQLEAHFDQYADAVAWRKLKEKELW